MTVPVKVLRPARAWMPRMWAMSGAVVFVACAGGLAWAQSKTAAVTFDVASIRSASFPASPEQFRSGQFRPGTTITGDRADFEFISLGDLIPYAYRVKNFQVQGPDWIKQSRWNIRAKMPAGSTEDQVPDMLRALLVDRFQLAIHHEKRDQPVYAMVVAKEGLKLEAVKDTGDKKPASAAENLPGGFPFPFAGRGRGGPDGQGPDGRGPDGRGGDNGKAADRGRGFDQGATFTGAGGETTRMTPDANNCKIHLEFSGLTMQALAETLSPFLDRPVVNDTNATGKYKASIDLPLSAMIGMIQNQARTSGFDFGRGGGPGRGGFDGGGRGGFDGGGRDGGRGAQLAQCIDPSMFSSDSPDASNGPLIDAIQKLGLKLDKRKEPFDTIIVDHIDKEPTEN